MLGINVSYINILRQLADQLQFSELQSNTQRYFQESNDLQSLPLLALAYAQLGAYAQANKILTQLSPDLDALDLDARVDLAGVYCVQRRVEAVLPLLEAALIQEPTHGLALARLAWCRLEQEDLSQARTLYQQAIALAPNRLAVWCALIRLDLLASELSHAQESFSNGIVCLERTASMLPEAAVDAFTLQLRGLQLEIWLAADARAEAEQWLTTRRDDLPESTWVALVIGYASLLAGHEQPDASEETLRDALNTYPENIELISQLAELAQVQGRTIQTVQLLRRAIRLTNKQEKPEVGLWVRLSSACLHHMDEQARKAATTAVELAHALGTN
jgi:tetratricopeptide (TPR) repeat protein